MKVISNIFLLIIILAFFSCQEDKEDNFVPKENKPSRIKKPTPNFNPDSAYIFIEKQVAFGTRVPNSKTHDQCGEWLVEKFRKFADTVVEQKGTVVAYDNTSLAITNIIASINPKNKKRILLCAHWDSRHIADQDVKDKDKPILAANDAGSGVAVLLEIARVIKGNPIDLGIDIVLFDAEDYGAPNGHPNGGAETWCLGSQFWAKVAKQNNYIAQYGILLDMVGAKDAVFYMEGTSRQYAPSIQRNVWNIASQLAYGHYFNFGQTPPITDDHLFINTIIGIPTIDIIQYDPLTPSHFGSYWHTHNDNMDIIDKNTLKAVGQTLLEVIYREDAK